MKKNIALVTGGFSGEAVISYKSAVTFNNNLDRDLYNVYMIDIHPGGWTHELQDGRKVEVDKNDFSLQIDSRKIKFDYNKGEARRINFSVPADNIQKGAYTLQVYSNGKVIGKAVKVVS